VRAATVHATTIASATGVWIIHAGRTIASCALPDLVGLRDRCCSPRDATRLLRIQGDRGTGIAEQLAMNSITDDLLTHVTGGKRDKYIAAANRQTAATVGKCTGIATKMYDDLKHWQKVQGTLGMEHPDAWKAWQSYLNSEDQLGICESASRKKK
jgi:hypothetical protein